MSEKSNTIRQAILDVFKIVKRPLTPDEVYNEIKKHKLYKFKTSSPLHVVATRLRRDCVGLEFAASSKHKYFQLLSNGVYWLKGHSIPKGSRQRPVESESPLNEAFLRNYSIYCSTFQDELLDTLNKLAPVQFESFCKNFLAAYGFKDTKITPATRDGGIDGFGKFTLGLTDLEVAFECKRWTKTIVGPGVIRRFRGSIPTSSVYGIIFTTSIFSKPAKLEAGRTNLKPVVLMDRIDIVNFMITNEFGVRKQEKRLEVFENFIEIELDKN